MLYSPVGTNRNLAGKNSWNDNWFDATGYGRNTVSSYVTNRKAYHTGADLNLANWLDSGAPVFSAGDGIVVYAGTPNAGWQLDTVVIKHDNGLYTRYAHLKDITVAKGQRVTKDSLLGAIGDYDADGKANDHLHFDISRKDLGAAPADWAGLDIARLERDYIDPLVYLTTQVGEAPFLWTPKSSANVRANKDLSSTVLGVIPTGTKFDATDAGDWVEVELKPTALKMGEHDLYAVGYKAFVSKIALNKASVVDSYTGYVARWYSQPEFAGTVVATTKHDAPLNLNFGAGNLPTGTPDKVSAQIIRESFWNLGSYTYTITADDGVRVWIDGNLIIDQWLEQAATPITRVVTVTAGRHVERIEYFEAGGNASLKVEIKAYQPVAGIPVVKHDKYQLGVNVLENAPAMWDALRRGCRFVLSMGNLPDVERAAITYPDAWFLFRTTQIPKGYAPTTAQMLNGLGFAAGKPKNIIWTFHNESDQLPYGTAEQMRKKFDFERGYAETIWGIDSDAKVAIGSFSHGTPLVTYDPNSSEAIAFSQTYAALANANARRCVIDYHTYTKGKRRLAHPPSGAPVYETKWFETRPEQVQLCTALKRETAWVSGEIGVEGGAGGMTWAGYTEPQFNEWCDDVTAAWAAYPSLGGAFFKYGERHDWQGYDMKPYIEALTRRWQK